MMNQLQVMIHFRNLTSLNQIHCLDDRYWCDGRTFTPSQYGHGCPDGLDEGTNCKRWECLPEYCKVYGHVLLV